MHRLNSVAMSLMVCSIIGCSRDPSKSGASKTASAPASQPRAEGAMDLSVSSSPPSFFTYGPTGFLASSANAYCAIASWPQWFAMGGPANGAPAYSAIPSGMISTGECPLPSGFFTYGPTGYLASSGGTYCAIASWPQWFAMGGPATGAPAYPVIPTSMTSTGACPLPSGFFTYGPSGYLASSGGTYCAIASWPQWFAMGGPAKGAPAYPVIPTSMTSTGACPLPSGFFTYGPSGYLAGSGGKYCAIASWPQWFAMGGPANGAPAYPVIPSSMSSTGECPVPATPGSPGIAGVEGLFGLQPSAATPGCFAKNPVISAIIALVPSAQSVIDEIPCFNNGASQVTMCLGRFQLPSSFATFLQTFPTVASILESNCVNNVGTPSPVVSQLTPTPPIQNNIVVNATTSSTVNYSPTTNFFGGEALPASSDYSVAPSQSNDCQYFDQVGQVVCGNDCQFFAQVGQVYCGNNCQYFAQVGQVACGTDPNANCQYFSQTGQVACGDDCQYFPETGQVVCPNAQGASCSYFDAAGQVVCGYNCQYFDAVGQVYCANSPGGTCTYFDQVGQVDCD